VLHRRCNCSSGRRAQPGISNSSAYAPDLDAVAITPLSGSNGNEVIGGPSGRCVDIDNYSISNGTQADLWDCAGGVNQSFTYTAGKQLVVYGIKCLGAYNNGTTNGTGVVISDGTITGVHSGRCLDAYGAGTTNGTRIVIWDCNGQTNQQWSRN
jgi:Ricin-type beta-trefoil lectin domain-like